MKGTQKTNQPEKRKSIVPGCLVPFLPWLSSLVGGLKMTLAFDDTMGTGDTYFGECLARHHLVRL